MFWGLQEQKQYCKRIKNLSRVFLDEYTKKSTWRDLKKLSFKTQFKIEFLELFTDCRKVLG